MSADGRVGKGVAVGFSSPTSGRARYVAGIDDVLQLMNEDVSDVILLVRESGATGVAPIVGDAGGIVCVTGGPTSHLALVAKEYGVPCVMGVEFDRDPSTLDGASITIHADGSIMTGGES